ncbi:MAG: DnaA ATPase domain-containing protein, partial [Eubacteriales bacterium]
MQTFKNVWEKALERLSKNLSPTTMDLWIKTILPVGYEDDCAVLLVETNFQRSIIMTKYCDVIKETLSDVVGFDMDINVVTSEDKRYASKQKLIPAAEIEDPTELPQNTTFSEYTFDNFIVGDSNKHAHAACLAVANNPAKAYNPLFLYGNTGLGKTHLLKAIANEIAKKFPTYKILYIKSEDFINELIQSMTNQTMQQFKAK